jgi:hypothetical protein
MSEQEVIEFEAQYFTDDDLFEEMSALEDEMVDGFVRNELHGEERREFQEGYVTSPARRANVEFARALTGQVDRVAEGTGSAPSKTGAFLRAFRVAPGWVAAAVLLLAAILGGSWVIYSNWQLNREMEQMRASTADAQRREHELQGQIAEITARLHKNDLPVGQGEAIPTVRPPGPDIISLALTPGTARSSGQSRTVRLSPAVLLVELQLYLEHDDYPAYDASVQTIQGSQLWRKNGLQSHSGTGGVRIVTLALPSNMLKSGDYLIQLTGPSPNGTMEDVEDYRFSVAGALGP